jgi:hypothetical protein
MRKSKAMVEVVMLSDANRCYMDFQTQLEISATLSNKAQQARQEAYHVIGFVLRSPDITFLPSPEKEGSKLPNQI